MSSLSLKSCNSLSANILFLQCLVRLHAFNHKIHPTETFRISLTSSSKYAASSAIGTASNHSPNLSSLLATSSDIILVVSNAMSSMIVTCTALPTLESINVMMKNPLVAQSVITIIDALLSIITETPKQPTSRITTWAVNSKIKESVLRAIVDLYLPLLEGQSDFDETSKVFHSILKPLITQMSFSITLSNYGIGAAGAKGSSTNGGGCDK